MERSIRTRILELCMLLCFGVMAVSSSVKADSISGTPQSVSFGTTYNYEGKEDKFYKINVVSSGKLTINAGSTNLDFAYFRLYNASADYITDRMVSDSDVTGRLDYQDYYYLTQGTYYIGVLHSDTQYESWQIRFDFEVAGESFTSPDDTTSQANITQIGQTYTGVVGYTDKIDYYKVDVTTSGKLNFSVSGSENMNYYFYFYSESGKQLYYEGISPNNITHLSAANIALNVKIGTYYYAIERYSSKGGVYQVRASLESSNESFPDTGKDDYINGANAIALGSTYNGQIGAINYEYGRYRAGIALSDDDYYSFTVESGKTYVFNMTSEFKDNCYIYDGLGTKLVSTSTSYNQALGSYKISEEFSLPVGTYYLRIGSENNPGNYSFSITEKSAVQKKQNSKPAKVKLKKVKSPKKRTLRIQWHKVAGATGYQVEVSKGNAKLKRTVKTTSASVVRLSRKKRYKVRVRAYVDRNGKRIYGAWSKKKTVKVK